ncbi:hypothetical protein NAH08_11060, partial [Francisella tularensis subsp. holarctica]|nr:hypothetical protein [Francisella tularensis subsp. holarctica]
IPVTNNKENGKNLLKYIYFSLALRVINKIFYLSFLRYEDVVDPIYLNYAISTFLFLLAEYLLCIIISFGSRFKFLALRVVSI